MTILLQLARRCVDIVEQIDRLDASVQSARLIVAARHFLSAVECFAEWRKRP